MTKIRSNFIPGILEKFHEAEVDVFFDENLRAHTLERGQQRKAGVERYSLDELTRFAKRLEKRIREPQEDLQIVFKKNPQIYESLKQRIVERMSA